VIEGAGVNAGLDVLDVISEPTAAALACEHDRKDSNVIAAYDDGALTWDI
jgi:molecular chaperone DnaK (HSP70)